MDLNLGYKNIITFNFIFNLFLIPFVICSFKSMKKVSDNGDYFVILDKGLYIYNFEKSKCETITNFGKSIFESDDEYNNIVISKNINSNSKEIKIAALINQHLYVHTYNNSNKNIENILINDLKDENHYIFPFYVQIIDDKLKIYLLKYEKKIFYINMI